MRKIAYSLLAGLLVMSAAAPAFADPPGGRHDRDNREWRRHDDRRDDRRDHRRDDRRDDHRDWRDDRRDDWRDDWRDDRRDQRYAYRDGYRDGYRADQRNDWRYAWPRGHYDYAPRWHRGGYIPRHSHYVVIDDYHRYRLPAPRHGHHYVDVDGEILLVAAATGLIVWALTN